MANLHSEESAEASANKLILLVEDSQGDARLVSESLELCGYKGRLQVLADGSEAWDYVRGQGAYASVKTIQPHLVLLDLSIPKKNGIEFLRELKADPLLKVIPVVMFSSHVDPRDVIRAYALGANAYVVKPASLTEFVRAIRAIEAFWGTVAELPSAVRDPRWLQA